MGLRLDETGVEIRELKIEAAPNLEAGLLLSTLDEIGNGLEFLPDNRRDEIRKLDVARPRSPTLEVIFQEFQRV